MSMKHRASREEIVKHLEDMAVGWHHLTKDSLRDASFQGAADIEGGASTVRVGHTTYIVDEGSDA
ncbi:hypothetical protein [Streptomyces sp. NPDC101393]|uniref:hypothetical protein n=1 Tax=Streptomyces sp. NPDC101393 TaxID=3366141 RepID=UPI003808C024